MVGTVPALGALAYKDKTKLEELLDVLLSSPANDEVITYETATSKWKNKPAAGGGSDTRAPDKICAADGTGDYTDIETAIASLSAGEHLHTKKGTYTITGILTIPANDILLSMSRGGLIKLGNAVNEHVFTLVGKTGVTFDGINIDGNRVNQTVDVSGIYQNAGSKNNYLNMKIEQCKYHGLYIKNTSYNQFHNLYFYQNCFANLGAGDLYFTMSNYNTLSNIISRSGAHALYFTNSNFNSLVGGYIHDSKHEGIRMEGGAGYGEHNTVNGVVLRDIVTDPLVITSRYNTFSDCKIFGGTYSLLTGDGNIITGCSFINTRFNALNIQGDHCLIENNVVINSGQDSLSSGIYLQNALNCIVKGNTCYDDQGTKTQKYGIEEYGTTDYSIITNNNCRTNQDATEDIHLVGANTIARHNQGRYTGQG